MKKIPTKIHDAWLLKPKVFGDACGFFLESWNRETFREIGLDLKFVQDNHSRSSRHVLNTETHDRFYVPNGCAHGFMVLSETCDFFYKVTTPYQPAADRSLRWNAPDLAIDWPIEIGLDPIVSPKDAAAATFAECEKHV